MKQFKKKGLFVFLILMGFGFIPPKKNIHLWLIGDSTMCDQPHDRSPVTGWGTPFKDFFDSTVTTENKARGGRSTRTFIAEGRWKEVYDSLEEGDYVLIQFGHNDEAKEPQYRDRYTPVPDYKTNLIKFIIETRSKKGIPVLITPVTRMNWDSLGNIRETHLEYSAAVKEIGAQHNVPVIDLDERSRELVQSFGPKWAKVIYMQLDSLENPHYPFGRKDNTHFTEYGARRMAELVLAEVRMLKLDLADRITQKIAP